MSSKHDIFNLMPDPAQATVAAVQEASAASFSMQVHELEIDGVRCFWAPGHGAMTAGLVFGVGEADERFVERGFTRLIGRMVRTQLGDRVEGDVGVSDTSFWVNGHRSDVSHALGAVLRALRSLPFPELAQHAAAVVAESTDRQNPAWAESLSISSGFDGPGAMALAATGLIQPDAQAIDEWRRRYFVKENTAAFFYGPRPEDLSFSDLPSGAAPTRRGEMRTLNTSPLEYRAAVRGPAVYAPISTGRMSTMAVDVTEQRLRSALASLPTVADDLHVEVVELDEWVSWLAIETSERLSQHQHVIDTIDTQLQQLAKQGPELNEVLESVKALDSWHTSTDGENHLVEVTRRARSAALGFDYVPYHAFRADLATKNRSEITKSLAVAMQQSIWVVPHDSPGKAPNAQPVPPWFRQVAGSAGSAPLATAVRGTSEQIVMHYEGVSQPVPLTHDDIVGVVVSNDGEVALHHHAGLVFRCAPREIDAEDLLRSFLLELPLERIRKVVEKLVIVGPDLPVDDGTDEPAESMDSEAPASSQQSDRSEVTQTASDMQPGENPDSSSPAPSADEGDSSDSSGRRKRSLRLVKNTGDGEEAATEPASEETTAGPQPVAVPDDLVTYSYPQAVGFAEAIIAEAWPMAERLYEEAGSPEMQAHFVKVAAATGGESGRFDPWVDGSGTPGLALMIRAAKTMGDAWEKRSASGAKPSKKATKEFWTALQTAEADILLGTVEHPESPVPWTYLLECARGLQRPRRAVEQIYINHVERGGTLAGHLDFQQYVSKKWFGSHNDMWDHVEFVRKSAPEGSPLFALAAMAFIEDWVDHCQTGLSNDDDASALLAGSGRQSQLVEAAESSFGHPEFDVLSIGAAKALEIWFTYYWSIGDFRSAAEVSAKMGKRYSGHPMVYFTAEPWSVVRATARRAAKNSGVG